MNILTLRIENFSYVVRFILLIDIGLTKISTKGQIVIPSDLRHEFKTGDKILIIKDDSRLILKNAKKISKDFIEDLEFAKKTDEALLRIEHDQGLKMKFDDFIEELKKW